MKPMPLCDSCGYHDATCVGRTEEGDDRLAFCCDECCGHDGEHGDCWMLAKATAPTRGGGGAT